MKKSTVADSTYREPGLLSKIWSNKSSYLFMLPFMIAFLIFTVISVVSAMVLSFTNFDMIQIPKFVGLTNYIRMFLDDKIFMISVQNTLMFAFITGPFSYISSVLIAWMVNEMGRKTRVILTILFYAPSLTGGAMFIFTFLFSGDAYGLLNSTLMQLGVLKEPINWLIDDRFNKTIVIIVQLWAGLGAGFLANIAGLQNVNRSMYEAAAIDGISNRFQELWFITIPSIRPQLMFSAVMTIASSFSLGGLAAALTGFPSANYSTHTIVLHISDVGATKMEMGYACAMATILFLFMILTRNVIAMLLKQD